MDTKINPQQNQCRSYPTVNMIIDKQIRISPERRTLLQIYQHKNHILR
jgi:hypothetical protein